MDMPIHANVYCDDVMCGRSTHLVLNPKTQRVTHVVVQEGTFAASEFLVPLDKIVESSPTAIKLRLSRDELIEMEPFTVTDYVSLDSLPANALFIDPMIGAYPRDYVLWPDEMLPDSHVLVEHREIPAGEVALVQGAQVVARDGTVGRVDELLTDPVDGKITHLVMRKGHLWGQMDVTIAVEQIERISERKIYLKLDTQGVAALPSMPV